MAAIASQALAAKANVAGAKLSFKKNAARSVKAFSARAQAVSAPAVRHDAPSPFSRATRRARARAVRHARARDSPKSSRRASNSSATARATRARGAGKGRGGESLPGTERGDARTADHARSLLSGLPRGARSGVARSPTPDFSAWRSRDSPAYWIGLVGATPSRVRSPRRVCASRRVSPKPAVRSIPSSPPARGILPLLTKPPPFPPSRPSPQGTELKKGVVTGEDYQAVLNHAREHGYAIPAVNCTMSPIINSCLEAAKQANSPMIVQFSNGGGAYMAGKGFKNEADQKAAVMGCVAGALHVRALAEFYGVPVVLHTDHCSKALLPWFDGLLEANEEYFAKHGEPLFSSHMLDLSEESIEENMEISAKYLKRMAAINCHLEVEIGITGGEEDGVDNTDVAPEDLYSKPEEIHQVYKALEPVAPGMYSIAAAFGNVHGVYSPGNVKLTPILGNAQKYIKKEEGLDADKPVYFVFHGGSGSSREDIREAIDYGVIKMNIDTDTQWSFWDGVKGYVEENKDYLQGQIGNPAGPRSPTRSTTIPACGSARPRTPP